MINFAHYLYQPFQLQFTPVLTVLLLLCEVRESTASTKAATAVATHLYTLIFQGPLHPVLPQKVYQLSHPAFGEINALITPVERQGLYFYYQADLSPLPWN